MSGKLNISLSKSEFLQGMAGVKTGIVNAVNESEGTSIKMLSMGVHTSATYLLDFCVFKVKQLSFVILVVQFLGKGV